MSAPSKDDVYDELRRQGIRAIRVDERIAPVIKRGFRGLTKRGWLVICLAVVVIVAIVAVVSWQAAIRSSGREKSSGHSLVRFANSRPRHQMPGVDVLRFAEDEFSSRGEAWLARLAQPGKILGGEPTAEELRCVVDDLCDALEEEIVISKDDSREVVDLKQVVVGMKDEIQMIVRGGRSVKEALEYLIERSRMEIRYVADIQSSDATEEEKSAKLRAMGLPDEIKKN